jgi:hypothetical protein
MRRSLAAVAAFLALAGATGLAHHETAARRESFPVVEDLVYLPSAPSLRLVSLGHTEMVADLVFLQTLLYFSASLTGTRNYDWLDPHLDTVIALDPDFRLPYIFGSRATMYNGNEITNRSVESSNHFLEAGLQRFPNDWELSFALGCNYIFELQTNNPKQKEAWRRTGGRWIRHAAIAGGGPPWLANLAAKIMSEEGQAEASERYLEEAYLTASDEKAKEELGRLLAARRRENFQRLAAAGKAFEESWQRTLPYAPGDLFVAIGAPGSPRLDLPFLSRDAVLEADAREAALADERDRQ